MSHDDSGNIVRPVDGPHPLMESNFPDYTSPRRATPLRRCENGYAMSDGTVYPVVAGVPRFVATAGYTDNFSLQWNEFAGTQMDDDVSQQSSARLWAETNWNAHDLQDLKILEVGSGAGRFTRALLSASRARLASIDYSDAVSANYRNNREFVEQGRLALAQASIYEMPYADDYFDKVFCLGVLQHTPDFRESIKCLLDKLRPGGELVVDFYPIRGWWTKLNAKYMLRPILKRLPPARLLWLIRKAMPMLIACYRGLSSVRLGVLTRFLPICDIDRTLPADLSREKRLEWCVLDTFDMFSPAYDNPQRIATVARWVAELGADVAFSDFVRYDRDHRAAVVRAIKHGV